MQSVIVTFDLEILRCFECGIQFGVPQEWVQYCMQNDDEIYCPNGHTNLYQCVESEAKPEATKEQVQQLRRELAQALHRAEQAEAAASCGRPAPPASDPKSEAEQDDPPEPLPSADGHNTVSKWHRGLVIFTCPKCSKKYRLPGPFRKHLHLDCNIENYKDIHPYAKRTDQEAS